MQAKLTHFWGILKQTFQEFNKDKASQMAAAQAYFTVFALPPLLLLLVMLLGVFLDDATSQQQIRQQAEQLGGSTASGMIDTIFEYAAQQQDKGWIAGLVSIGILLFSATNIFAHLQSSLDTIWGVEIKPGAGLRHTLINRLMGFGLILGLGAVIVISMITDVVLALGQNFVAEQLGLSGWVLLFKAMSFAVFFALMTAVFTVTFAFLPDLKIRFRDVIVGALFTSTLFTISRFALSLYLSHSDMGSAYGAAGSLMVFLFFIFVSMQLFFFGAEFTEVYARSHGDAFEPAKSAQWLPGRPRESELMPGRQPISQTARREQVGISSSKR